MKPEKYAVVRGAQTPTGDGFSSHAHPGPIPVARLWGHHQMEKVMAACRTEPRGLKTTNGVSTITRPQPMLAL